MASGELLPLGLVDASYRRIDDRPSFTNPQVTWGVGPECARTVAAAPPPLAATVDFNSRDDLITQAAAFALSEGTAKMERSARKNPEDARAGLIDAYLAKQHRDGPATGCALVTLGAAAGRGDQQIQQAYENQVRTYLDLIAGLDEDADTPRAEAMLTLSALVGAMLISRAVADQDFSDELLETVAEQLTDRTSCEPPTDA
ncbi:hypothetical protein [Streptomyces nigra]|uniref:hypothetical protein n=1 Tax=Streptomyces nigra TaxID=1827580 RepID=UPI0037F7B670